MATKSPHVLVVFDFDHTLVDGNTDTWITQLSPSAKAAIYDNRKKEMCWTNIMQLVFELLHQENISEEDYMRCFESLQFIEGIKETCEFICKNSIPCIIISDSNTYFIDHLLKRDGLSHVFCQVFTNPAEWKQGCLHVERYHSHACKFCPDNLCKKEVLSDFINNHTKTHPSFDHVFYIGDGRGDFCPAAWLSKSDYIMAREGYKLLELLREDTKSGVEATVQPWSSGFQILESIKKAFLGEH